MSLSRALCIPLLMFASTCILSASLRSAASGMASQITVERFRKPQHSELAILPPHQQNSRPITIAVVGLTGDGKSTFCNWFLGGTAHFKASASTKSETKKIQIAKGRIFGDATYPEVIIADTPGLADSDGDDATIWHDIVEDLRETLDGELDVILWIVNGANSRWSGDRQTMIEAQRFTFGYNYWGHMAVLFTHYSSKASADDPSGHNPEEKAAKIKEWRNMLKASDNTYFADGISDGIIDSVDFYFTDTPADLSKRFFSKYDHEWAHARDAVSWTFDPSGTLTYAKSGMADLHKFVLDISQKINHPHYKALNLQEMSPRMGPGEVIDGQEFECEWPGKVHCSLNIGGDAMSDKDEIRLIEQGSECGKNGKLNASKYGMQFTQQRARTDGGGSVRTFELGSLQNEKSVGTFEICYCEAGRCEDDRRFGQHAGRLIVKWSECVLPSFSNAQMCAYPAVDPFSETAESLKPLSSIEVPEKLSRLGSATFKCDEGYTGTGRTDAQNTFNVDCNPKFGVDVQDWIKCLHPPCECNIVHCAAVPRENSEPIAKKNAVVDFGSDVRFTCKTGFTASPDGKYHESSSYNATCGADGKMSVEQCTRVSCGVFPNHSTVRSNISAYELIRFGDKVEYTCQPGYSFDGRLPADGQYDYEDGHGVHHELPTYVATCEANGRLIAKQCIRVSCGISPKHANARSNLSVDDLVSFGDKVQYTCLPGFSLDGRPLDDGQYQVSPSYVATCGAEGKMSAGRCIRVSCGTYPQHANARSNISVGDEIRFGDKVKYTCQTGYSLDGHILAGGQKQGGPSYVATCEAGGKMSAEQCVRVSCGTFPSQSNAVPNISGGDLIHFGDNVKYACQLGYSFDGRPPAPTQQSANYIATCAADGTIPVKECVRVSCGTSPQHINARSNTSADIMIHVGDKVEYTCQPGYSVDGFPPADFPNQKSSSYVATCEANGTMSAEQCVRVSCGISPKHANARSNLSVSDLVRFGDEVTYTCKLGYSPGGRPPADGEYHEPPSYTATCGADGKMSAEMCALVSCGSSPKHAYARSNVSDGHVIHVGDKVKYTCLPGYSIDGRPPTKAENQEFSSYVATCEANGKMSAEQCVRVSCDFSSHANALSDVPLDALIHFGEKVKYTCKPGYSLDGRPPTEHNVQFEMFCTAIGKLLGTGSCVPVNCGRVGDLNGLPGAAAESPDAEITYPNSVAYKCNDGYVAKSDGKKSFMRQCLQDGNFEYHEGCRPVTCFVGEDPVGAHLISSLARRTSLVEIAAKVPHLRQSQRTQPAGATRRRRHSSRSEPRVKHGARRTRRALSEAPESMAAPSSRRRVKASARQRPPSRNASVGKLVISYGETVKYRCNPGFSLNGFDLGSNTNFEYERSCGASGTEGVLSDASKCLSTTDKIMPPKPIGYVIACDKQAKHILDVNTNKEKCQSPRVVCAPGYAGAARVNTNVSGRYVELNGCEPCPKGTSSKVAALSQCPKCPANQYQDNVGSQSCKKCPAYRATDPYAMATSVSSCIDVSKHKCCCSGKDCFLVDRNFQKGADGLFPKLMAQQFGGLCPMIQKDRRCATWGTAATARASRTTEVHLSKCHPGAVSIVGCKCHGLPGSPDACEDNADE